MRDMEAPCKYIYIVSPFSMYTILSGRGPDPNSSACCVYKSFRREFQASPNSMGTSLFRAILLFLALVVDLVSVDPFATTKTKQKGKQNSINNDNKKNN